MKKIKNTPLFVSDGTNTWHHQHIGKLLIANCDSETYLDEKYYHGQLFLVCIQFKNYIRNIVTYIDHYDVYVDCLNDPLIRHCQIFESVMDEFKYDTDWINYTVSPDVCLHTHETGWAFDNYMVIK